MELKDFIKGVLSDIVYAVEECQKDFEGKAQINPVIKNYASIEPIESSRVHDIHFDVALSTTSDGEKSGGISVFSAHVGAKSTNSLFESSRVKFSIPITYPTKQIMQDSKNNKNIPSYLDITGTVSKS